MKLRPFPHQRAGADHLAAHKVAGLFDDPRVGKNLAVVMAADRLGYTKGLFVTTVSGRAVGAQAFRDNQTIPRKIQILEPKDPITGDIVFVSWAAINNPSLFNKLLQQPWQVIVLDESHYAKSFTAKRTRAVYGQPRLDGRHLDQSRALVVRSERVWLLTGTPIPHDLSDLYPALRALTPELLMAHQAGVNYLPEVITMRQFDDRYTIQKPFKVNAWTTKMVKIGGKNESELKARLAGNRFMLRRTQKDVGILPARYSMRPLRSDDVDWNLEAGMSREEIEEILAHNRYTDTNLARLLHMHGIAKAHAVVDAVAEEIECGLDKIVLGYWHTDVGDILRAGLHEYGVVGIDGATQFVYRDSHVAAFSNDGGPKIFLQQLAAAGESIDLSASGLLWFVESVFSPATMKQAAERVTNIRNVRSPVVETCYIPGTVDEIVQGRLASLWHAIRQVINT